MVTARQRSVFPRCRQRLTHQLLFVFSRRSVALINFELTSQCKVGLFCLLLFTFFPPAVLVWIAEKKWTWPQWSTRTGRPATKLTAWDRTVNGGAWATLGASKKSKMTSSAIQVRSFNAGCANTHQMPLHLPSVFHFDPTITKGWWQPLWAVVLNARPAVLVYP